MPIKPEHQKIIDKYTSTDHKGKSINKYALLKSNPMVARIITARLASMSDDERSSLKAIVTPQTGPALKILLPELAKLLDKGMSANGTAG